MTLTGYIVGAKGNTGRSISGVTENNDYTITISFTDGTTFTTEPIPGFTSVDLDENFDLVVTKTDGTEVTVETGLGDYNTTLSGYKTDAENAATSAGNSKDAASGSATTATQQATLARSYAKGDTSSRTGEATDNAEYFKGQASESATSASSSASTAEAQALVSEGYAQGTQVSTPVTSDSPYYHNNSKYFSELASASDTSAASSASSANTDALKAEGYAVGKQNGTTQTSGTYYHNNAQYYNSQATQAASISANQATASGTQALKSEGFAVGEQSGTPVTSGSDYYENNAKYYAGEAADSATAAEGYAESINPSNFAPAIIETAHGSIASFDDGADNVPVKDLIAEIVPLQNGSGDPSPDNVRAISGWTQCNVGVCGKNMFNPSTITNGFLDANGDISTSTQFQTSDYIKVNEGTTYTASYYRASEGLYDGMRIAWYDKNKTFIQRDGTNHEGKEVGQKQVSAVAPSGAVFARTSFTYSNGVAEKPQFETGSTATTYEPYNGEVHTISFASAGTVYGGSIDVTSGVLTVDKAEVDMGTLNFARSTSWGNMPVFQVKLDDVKSPLATEIADMYCESYKPVSGNTLYAGSDDSCCINSGYFRVTDNAYSDAPTFKSSVNGKKLVYPLATPQTYQLTPTEVKTLLKNNNIWADTGDVTVEYVADTKTFIENLVNA